MNTERVIEKIKKLLAMADPEGNASENERAMAMRQATKLMDKYAVSMAEVEGDSPEDRGEDRLEVGQRRWRHAIYASIADLYGCKIYLNRYGRSRTFVVVVGREAARMAVLSLAAWVCMSIDAERGRRDMPKREVESWNKGASAGVHATVQEIKEERKRGETVDEPGTALAVVGAYESELKANVAWMDENCGPMRKSRPTRVRSAAAYNNGREYGSSIKLNNQLGGK